MIILKHEIISNLPVVELVSKEHLGEKLPTVFFYHGWESYKERVLEYGYSMAKVGFRVVLPEAYNHGERKAGDEATQDPMNFWQVVTSSVREFPVIAEFYINANKTLPDRIGVAGLSMGGITTSAILTQYDWVKSASVLMGSPSPIEFTKWLFQNYEIEGKSIYDTLDAELIESRLNELAPISLNLQPEKVAGRPVYFWHGVADTIVPASITQEFVEKNSTKEYGKNMNFELTAGVGHKVPGEIVTKMTEYFKVHL